MEVRAWLWPPRATAGPRPCPCILCCWPRLPSRAPKLHSCAQARTSAQGSVGVTPQALPSGTWDLPTECQGKKT